MHTVKEILRIMKLQEALSKIKIQAPQNVPCLSSISRSRFFEEIKIGKNGEPYVEEKRKPRKLKLCASK